MATYLSNELGGSALQTSAPVGYKPRASVYQAKLKRLRATFTLGAGSAIGDTYVIGSLPVGATFAFGIITASATMGTATLAIGIASSTGKYRAAATFTAVDTPTMFGPAAQAGASDPALTAEEQVILTDAVAALPTSGTLVIDIYYSMPQ